MERLHQGLLDAGVDSRILCGRKTTRSAFSKPIPGSSILKSVESILGKVTYELGLNDIHYLTSFKVMGMEEYRRADILHFHGTHGYFNYLALPQLVKHKPAVFTLHDMWPLTGHCSYSYDCERWKIGCGQCPYPEAHPAIKRDNTRLEWKLKNWVYKHSHLTVVVLCNWLKQISEQSLLKRFPIHNIPNGLDLNVYRPLDKGKCRTILGISECSEVLMFVSLQLNDRRKGTDLLLQSLKSLPQSLKKDMVLLTLGEGGQIFSDLVGIKTLDLGYVRNDHLKAIAYSAASLFVLPTRADNLPLVLQESMACGTPMVSFNVGGVPELVRPGLTGCLVEPENVEQLAKHILELLEDESHRTYLAQKCREIATTEYSIGQQVQSHIHMYKDLLH